MMYPQNSGYTQRPYMYGGYYNGYHPNHNATVMRGGSMENMIPGNFTSPMNYNSI
jgi:hypothetical protein